MCKVSKRNSCVKLLLFPFFKVRVSSTKVINECILLNKLKKIVMKNISLTILVKFKATNHIEKYVWTDMLFRFLIQYCRATLA